MNTREKLDLITRENLRNGTLGELWEKVPEYVRGPEWADEIVDLAMYLRDYCDNEGNLTGDTYDIANERATSEIEDYYTNINKRVQALSLWAYTDLDEEVQEFNGGTSHSLTELNSDYLFCAMLAVNKAILEFATEKELEEVSA